MTIRRGNVRDRSFFLDLGRRTVEDSLSEVRRVPLPLAQANYERLVSFVDEQSHAAFVAESAVEPLGFALMVDDLPDEVTGLPQAFVAYMAVEPHARRGGIGRALLAAVESEVRTRGLPFVSLMVTEDNVAARALYAQAGFATERRLLCKAL